MPTAKKLPSGSWRCLAYSHSEPVFDEKGHIVIDAETGKPKTKRIYESFTSDDKTRRGKREAELLATEYQLDRKRKQNHTERLTLWEAIAKYITSASVSLSPKTIEEYWKIQKNAFQNLMDIELRNLNDDILQEAITLESQRPNRKCTKNPKPISAKTLRNEYGLICSVILKYAGGYVPSVKLPEVQDKIIDLPDPDVIFNIIKGTDIELACLLAMWLSFSMEEIRGLKKSTSIQGDYIVINQVVVTVNNKPLEKDLAKTPSRIRKHLIPEYIKGLIDALPPGQDYLVTKNGSAISKQFSRLMKKNGIKMNFHKLRHVNASVMALLRVPDKYAMQRGGWKSDHVMKRVYTHTFSDKRMETDAVIDEYFENAFGLSDANQSIDRKKYQAYLILFDKDDCAESLNSFQEFMQHEMQHEYK